MSRTVGNETRIHLVALGLYAVVTVAVCGRILARCGHVTFPSFSRDNYAGFWNLWWVKEALASGHDLFFTDLLYFPQGTTLAFTEFGPLYGVITAPFLTLSSSPHSLIAAHNLLVALTFILMGYTTFLFARWESSSTVGGLFAGLVLSLSAFRLHHIETLNLLSAYWIPLIAWLLGSWIFREAVPYLVEN